MEECEEIEERGVQRDHPPAPEKTFRGRWMISDRKRTDLRRAAAVASFQKRARAKTKERLLLWLFFAGTFLLRRSVLFLVAMTKKPL